MKNTEQIKAKKWVVYTITHNPTAHIEYVGITSNFPQRRYAHLHYITTTKDWLKELGAKNVTITPVAIFDSKLEAQTLEAQLIEKYNTTEHNHNKSGGVIADWNSYCRLYNQSHPEVKEYQKNYHAKYDADPEHKAKHREACRKYIQKKRLEKELAKQAGIVIEKPVKEEVIDNIPVIDNRPLSVKIEDEILKLEYLQTEQGRTQSQNAPE